MGDILTPGQNLSCLKEPDQWIDTEEFLRKDLYLGEFSENFILPNGETFDEKAKVRLNLNRYDKLETDLKIDEIVDEELVNHLNANDPHGDRAYADSIVNLANQQNNNQINSIRTLLDLLFVKKDGSTPFTRPLTGVYPKDSNHLATKKYVDNIFRKIQVEAINNIFNNISEVIEYYSLNKELLNDGQVVIISDGPSIHWIYLDDNNNIQSIELLSFDSIENLYKCINSKELVTSAALNDLNDRLIILNNKWNNITLTFSELLNRNIENILNIIEDNEFVISYAINDLNNRIGSSDSNLSGDIQIITLNIQQLTELVDSNELVISNALNDLNSRLSSLNTNFTYLYEDFHELSIGSDDNEVVISAALNDLNERIIELNELLQDSDNKLSNDIITIQDLINLNELIISSSLNDLNERIITLNEELNNKVQDLNDRIDESNYKNCIKIYNKTNTGSHVSPIILEENSYNIWGEVSDLYVKIGSLSDTSKLALYMFEFESGSTPTNLVFEDTIVKWESPLNIEANKIYQVKIIRNIGTIIGVDAT